MSDASVDNRGSSGSSRHILYVAIVLLAALGVFAMQAVDLINFAVDDTFIVLRIVNNVLHGHGFVYNIGENIEGYSDWLWVVLLLGPIAIGQNISQDPWTPMWIEKGMSLLFGLGTVVLLYFLVRNLFRGQANRNLVAAFAALGLAACTPFVTWSLGGLEATFCAFLFTVVLIIVEKVEWSRTQDNRKRLFACLNMGVVLGFLVLTRPEAALYVVLLYLSLVILLRWRLSQLCAILLPLVLIVSTFLAWRWFTYHSFVPNTYYAKTGTINGGVVLSTKYTLGSISAILGPLLLFFPLGFFAVRRDVRFLIAGGSLLLSALIFSMLVGGDWMPGSRFFIPVAPILVLISIRGAVAVYDAFVQRARIRKLVEFLLVCACITIAFANAFSQRSLVRGQLTTLASGFVTQPGHALPEHQAVAEWFHARHPQPFTLATGEAGLIGYINPQMTLIDCYGLMDTTISHRLHKNLQLDPEYLLSRKPDFVLLDGLGGNRIHERHTAAYSDLIFADTNFSRDYVLDTLFPRFTLYRRR